MSHNLEHYENKKCPSTSKFALCWSDKEQNLLKFSVYQLLKLFIAKAFKKKIWEGIFSKEISESLNFRYSTKKKKSVFFLITTQGWHCWFFRSLWYIEIFNLSIEIKIFKMNVTFSLKSTMKALFRS